MKALATEVLAAIKDGKSPDEIVRAGLLDVLKKQEAMSLRPLPAPEITEAQLEMLIWIEEVWPYYQRMRAIPSFAQVMRLHDRRLAEATATKGVKAIPRRPPPEYDVAG